MSFAKISMVAAAALSMASAPVLAQAASPASKLSVSGALSSARTGAAVSDKSELAGGSLILALLAAGLVIGGIIILADSDDEPASP